MEPLLCSFSLRSFISTQHENTVFQYLSSSPYTRPFERRGLPWPVIVQSRYSVVSIGTHSLIQHLFPGDWETQEWTHWMWVNSGEVVEVEGGTQKWEVLGWDPESMGLQEQNCIFRGKCESSALVSQTPTAQDLTRKTWKKHWYRRNSKYEVGVVKDLLMGLLRRHRSYKVEFSWRSSASKQAQRCVAS